MYASRGGAKRLRTLLAGLTLGAYHSGLFWRSIWNCSTLWWALASWSAISTYVRC